MTNVVSHVLDSFSERVQGTLRDILGDAENSAIAVEIEAGRQIQLAITNAKSAYSDILNETIEKVDVAAQAALGNLAQLVSEFQQRVDTSMQNLADRATLLIMTLPFHNKEPQVWGFHPRYVDVSREECLLTVKGKFDDAGHRAPSLKIKGKEFTMQPSGSKTLELQFLIPMKELFPDGTAKTDSYFPHSIVELSVPWEKGILGPYWHTVNTYLACLSALPASPGQVIASFTKEVQERKHVVSPPLHFECPYPVNRREENFPVVADQGYQVVQGSSSLTTFRKEYFCNGKFDYASPHGKWSSYFVSDTNNMVIWRVEGVGYNGHDRGVVDFNLEFDEVATTTVQSRPDETYVVPWTGAIEIKLNAGEKVTLTFKAFDKSVTDFTPDSINNSPYISWQKEEDSVRITPRAPSGWDNQMIATLRLGRVVNAPPSVASSTTTNTEKS